MEDQSRPSPRLSAKFHTLLTVGVVTGIVLVTLIRASKPAPDAPHYSSPNTVTTTPEVQAIDQRAIREKAWSKIEPRLAKADEATAAEIEKAIDEIQTFFTERKGGSRSLAAVLLSMKGKWKVIQSKISQISDQLPFAEQDADIAFLNQKFGEYVFTPQELQQAVEGAIRENVERLNSIENRLLVEVRADLSEGELAAAGIIPALQTADAFQREFDRLRSDVSQLMRGEVQHDVSREIGSIVAGEVAAQIAVRVAVAVGTRLGISAGVLGIGAASSWATFGAGLVAAIVVDLAIDWIERMAGRDPEAAIAGKIEDTLAHIQGLFVEGDPDAWQAYRRLRELADRPASAEAGREFREAAQSIEASGNLGIHFDLQQLHESRKGLRREALKRLILSGET